MKSKLRSATGLPLPKKNKRNRDLLASQKITTYDAGTPRYDNDPYGPGLDLNRITKVEQKNDGLPHYEHTHMTPKGLTKTVIKDDEKSKYPIKDGKQKKHYFDTYAERTREYNGPHHVNESLKITNLKKRWSKDVEVTTKKPKKKKRPEGFIN